MWMPLDLHGDNIGFGIALKHQVDEPMLTMFHDTL